MNEKEIKEFLDEKFYQYNVPSYIDSDPIQIPHSFSKKEDIEISAFLASTIAWGQRKTIIKNAKTLIKFMDDQPYDFIMNAENSDLEKFNDFKHRTFNGIDCKLYIKSLQNIYKNHGGLESFFTKVIFDNNLIEAIATMRRAFFEIPHESRTQKHFPDIFKGSAAKRLNMFLRWMVRDDKIGVDFGIWKNINASQLFIPLDVHVGNVARKLGILKRNQNDWKSVIKLTQTLRSFDSNDPVKYDYALFGLGVFEKF